MNPTLWGDILPGHTPSAAKVDLRSRGSSRKLPFAAPTGACERFGVASRGAPAALGIGHKPTTSDASIFFVQ